METVAPLFWEYTPEPPAPKTWRTWFTDTRPSLYATQPFVDRQLFRRQKPSPARWGTDVSRIRIGQLICRVAKEQYGWSNDYFLPDDPFNIVFLVLWDDLDIVEVAMKIEEGFWASTDTKSSP